MSPSRSEAPRGAERNRPRSLRAGTLFSPLLVLILLAAAQIASRAAAHAYLTASDPAGGSVVETPPERVVLTMSEAVEMRFSTFKVLRLDDPPEERRALVDTAEALVETAILRRDDGDARVDTGVRPEAGTATETALELADGLEPGTYVVMWRVLSVDTHTGQDFTLFRYDPDPGPGTATEPTGASDHAGASSADRDTDEDSETP